MKDAKGHGSNSRGYDGPPEPQSKQHMARQAAKAANSPNSWEARYGTKADRDRLSAEAINAGVDAGFKSSRAEAGLTNASAASALASGPKSAPAPVHDSMHSSLNAWGQTSETAKAARKQIRDSKRQGKMRSYP